MRRIHEIGTALSAIVVSLAIPSGSFARDSVSGVAAAATGMSIPVGNCNDSGPGSLRAAVANALSGDTIDMRALRCTTITLTTGPIEVAQHDLTVSGPGRGLTVSGNHATRVFRHPASGLLRITGLSIANGSRIGPLYGMVKGGCIYTEGNLRLENAQVHDCSIVARGDLARGDGGAIYAVGDVTLFRTDVFSNFARGTYQFSVAYDGGIRAGGNLVMNHSSLHHNYAKSGSGGAAVTHDLLAQYSSINDNTTNGSVAAISVGHDVTLRNSSIVRNDAKFYYSTYFGYAAGFNILIVNSTIADNAAELGAGVNMGEVGSLTIANSTVAFNNERLAASSSCMGALNWFGDIELESAIVANNVCGGVPADIRVPSDDPPPTESPIAGANNLVGSSTTVLPRDTIRSDPRLAPLADNGGETLTHALLADSPAIDMGNNIAALVVDQRGAGFPRVKGAHADIGAVER